MSKPCTVVIGGTALLEELKANTGATGEVLGFSDTDALAALEAISARRPQVIALERLFAATSRGAALINRIKDDPDLTGSEIRVISHDGRYSRVSPRRASQTADKSHEKKEKGHAPAPEPSAALDYRGTRRAARFRMIEGAEAQVDGTPARLVDLSVRGAQVISGVALKPQQRVRVTLVDRAGTVRFNALVAWASFEIPKGVTHYRAGIEFMDGEADAIEAYCARHKKQD
jgi:hypothetical protein